jgi:hypothetical protein
MNSFEAPLERPWISRGIGIFLAVTGVISAAYVMGGRNLLDGAFCPSSTTAFGYLPHLVFLIASLLLSLWTIAMGLSVIGGSRRSDLQSGNELLKTGTGESGWRRVRIESTSAITLGIGFLAANLLSLAVQASAYYCANPTGVFIHSSLMGGPTELWTDARTIRFTCHYGKHRMILLDTEVGFLDGAGVQLSSGLEDVTSKSFALIESSLQGQPWKIKMSEDGPCPSDLAMRLGVTGSAHSITQ